MIFFVGLDEMVNKYHAYILLFTRGFELRSRCSYIAGIVNAISSEELTCYIIFIF